MTAKFPSRALSLTLAALTLGLFPLAASATHSWGGYHWARTSNPFTVKLGDNLTSVWDPILATSSADWSASNVLDTRVVTGQATPRRCRATLGQVEVCNLTYGNNGWLGIASISVSGSHITQGSVKVNDTYFNTPTYDSTAWRNLVMCQEVGHTFGLDHQDENFSNANLGTCMDYTNNPTTNQRPNQHDYDELVTIYSHLDSSTTVSQAVDLLGRVGDFNSQKEWGKVVHESASGRHSVYELDFGNGHRIYTFVTWALDSDTPGRR